ARGAVARAIVVGRRDPRGHGDAGALRRRYAQRRPPGSRLADRATRTPRPPVRLGAGRAAAPPVRSCRPEATAPDLQPPPAARRRGPMSLETGLALLAALLVSCGGAMLLTPLAGRLGAHLGLVDRPRPGEVQKLPVPRSGGYGLIFAFLLAVGL